MTALSFPVAIRACRTTARQSRRFVIAVKVSLLLCINLRAITIVNSASCNVLLEQKCSFKNSIYNATTILQLSVDGAALWTNYDANVGYHWGGIKEDTQVSGKYNMADNTGEMEEIARTHTWSGPGEYYSGYTVTFDESIGCDTPMHVDYWLVYFYPDDSECGFMDVDGSNVPTASVTMSAAVDEEVIITSAPTTTIEQTFAPAPMPTLPPLIPTLSPVATSTPTTATPTLPPVVTDTPTILSQLEESVIITSSPSATTIFESSTPTTAAVEMVLSPSGTVELVAVVHTTLPTEDVQNTFSSTTLNEEAVDTDSATSAKHDGDHPNNTYIYIFVSVSVGSIIILASMVFFYRKELKQRREYGGFKVQTVMVDNDRASTQSGTRSSPPSTTHESYFGTVQQSSCDYGDDISTLGDPYMGEGAITSNNLADDPTVGGSTFVSKQDQLFTYGLRPRLGTADLESRMGNTTVGTGNSKAPNGMQFNEDITLEDIYQAAQLGVGEGHHHDFITVIAPAGQLGIVLNNPSDDFPMVYAVKDTSVLNGSVQVGDLLVSVDEVECKGMSSRTISSFLSSRSQNPTRTLILARGSVDV